MTVKRELMVILMLIVAILTFVLHPTTNSRLLNSSSLPPTTKFVVQEITNNAKDLYDIAAFHSVPLNSSPVADLEYDGTSDLNNQIVHLLIDPATNPFIGADKYDQFDTPINLWYLREGTETQKRNFRDLLKEELNWPAGTAPSKRIERARNKVSLDPPFSSTYQFLRAIPGFASTPTDQDSLDGVKLRIIEHFMNNYFCESCPRTTSYYHAVVSRIQREKDDFKMQFAKDLLLSYNVGEVSDGLQKLEKMKNPVPLDSSPVAHLEYDDTSDLNNQIVHLLTDPATNLFTGADKYNQFDTEIAKFYLGKEATDEQKQNYRDLLLREANWPADRAPSPQILKARITVSLDSPFSATYPFLRAIPGFASSPIDQDSLDGMKLRVVELVMEHYFGKPCPKTTSYYHAVVYKIVNGEDDRLKYAADLLNSDTVEEVEQGLEKLERLVRLDSSPVDFPSYDKSNILNNQIVHLLIDPATNPFGESDKYSQYYLSIPLWYINKANDEQKRNFRDLLIEELNWPASKAPSRSILEARNKISFDPPISSTHSLFRAIPGFASPHIDRDSLDGIKLRLVEHFMKKYFCGFCPRTTIYYHAVINKIIWSRNDKEWKDAYELLYSNDIDQLRAGLKNLEGKLQ